MRMVVNQRQIAGFLFELYIDAQFRVKSRGGFKCEIFRI